MNRPPVIGLSGSYGGLNLGDEAILAAVIKQLRNVLTDVEITVFSRNPDYTRQHHQVERVVEGRSAMREELAHEVSRLDLLLLGGGGILYDREAQSYLFVARIAQELGVPTATYAIGAGPLERAAEREAVASVLGRMSYITVRDASSRRLLQEIGVESDIIVTADPALALDPAPFTADMLQSEGVGKDRPVVGMSVREPGGAQEDLDVRVYTSVLANAADFVVECFDARVLFVPMEREDIRQSHRVIAEMGKPEHARILQGSYAPEQILGMMHHLEFALGMRLHFLVLAARAGIPLLALPYASKVTSFLAALDVPAPELIYRNHTGLLLAFIASAWANRDELAAHISERAPELQRSAGRTPHIVAQLLRDGSASTAAGRVAGRGV